MIMYVRMYVCMYVCMHFMKGSSPHGQPSIHLAAPPPSRAGVPARSLAVERGPGAAGRACVLCRTMKVLESTPPIWEWLIPPIWMVYYFFTHSNRTK